MTGGNDGVSFTIQEDLPGSQEDMNSNATTTNDGAAVGHSFTTQGEAGRGQGGGQGWQSGPPTCYWQSGILLPTAQKHFRMHNECWKHPNNMPTNQTSNGHNG